MSEDDNFMRDGEPTQCCSVLNTWPRSRIIAATVVLSSCVGAMVLVSLQLAKAPMRAGHEHLNYNAIEFDAWMDKHVQDSFSGSRTYLPQTPVETLLQNKVIAIRHGQSKGNRWQTVVPASYMKTAERAHDTLLSVDGLEQCEARQEVTDQLKISKVYISPMRRTIQTAYHMLKTHPNFEHMQFILSPEIREVLLGSDCTPMDVFDFLDFCKDYFPDLDTSLMEKAVYPELWFLSSAVKHDKDFLSQLIADYNGFTYDAETELFSHKDTGKLVQPRSLKTGPSVGTRIEFFKPYMEYYKAQDFGWSFHLLNSFETPDDLWYITEQFKDYLHENEPQLFDPETGNEHSEQIALVTHLITVQVMATDWTDYDMDNLDGPVPFPEDLIFFDNAQVIGMDKYLL